MVFSLLESLSKCWNESMAKQAGESLGIRQAGPVWFSHSRTLGCWAGHISSLSFSPLCEKSPLPTWWLSELNEVMSVTRPACVWWQGTENWLWWVKHTGLYFSDIE